MLRARQMSTHRCLAALSDDLLEHVLDAATIESLARLALTNTYYREKIIAWAQGHHVCEAGGFGKLFVAAEELVATYTAWCKTRPRASASEAQLQSFARKRDGVVELIEETGAASAAPVARTSKTSEAAALFGAELTRR